MQAKQNEKHFIAVLDAGAAGCMFGIFYFLQPELPGKSCFLLFNDFKDILKSHPLLIAPRSNC